MNNTTKRLARELAEAIAAAAATDPRVASCRAKARAAGYEMKVSIEAVVGFSSATESDEGTEEKSVARRKPFEISTSDRRFLRSLRIAADQTTEEV